MMKLWHRNAVALLTLSEEDPPGLWCFLCFRPKQAVEQIVEWVVIWDTMKLMWHHCQDQETDYVVWAFKRKYKHSCAHTVNAEWHYSDIIMSITASQITGISFVYSTVCSGTDQRKHQSSTSLPVVRGIHRWPVNSSHKGPVTRKMFPPHDVILTYAKFVVMT